MAADYCLHCKCDTGNDEEFCNDECEQEFNAQRTNNYLAAMELTLPWPAVTLSPNCRAHWSKKSKAAKSYRKECALLCRVQNLKIDGLDEKLHLFIDFYPPRNGRVDGDNMLARIKSGIDGIADHLDIDDSNFVFHPMIKEKLQGGCVKVRFAI
ncbi:MAG: hypothetical protein M0Q44_01265 [Methylobacter sp.]|jgi:crossover junction endodeoxyribonuclease RusA|nr:hypothetical protein [Methylobacter sp.]